MAREDASEVRTLEEGYLYLFWRPKVEHEEPEGRGDVQRLYLVLSPHGEKNYRLLVIGRQELPDSSSPGRSRRWGFVQSRETNPRRLLDELGEVTYQTKTRGERHQPAARPAGEGVYEIVRHGDHTHFAYALDLPEEPGDVQQALNIDKEASFIVTVRNPDAPAPPQAGLGRHDRPDYPEDLSERFGGRKFADVDPPSFLDYEGSEILLIAASDDVQSELGLDIDAESESSQTAAIFRDLKLRKSQQPIAPLTEGRWE